MPFGAIAQPAAAAGPTVKTGIDACLTHARANASAGDVYQDATSKACFVYDASGSGVLVPAEWAGNTLTLVTNAGGGAYITLADDEADVTGRGWVVTETGASASISKTPAGSKLIITATTNGHYCTLTFSPSSPPEPSKKYLIVMKVAIVASPSTAFATFWLNDGAKERALVPDNGGVAGSWVWANSATPKGSAGCVSGTSAKWMSGYYGANGQPLLISEMTDPAQNSQALHADMRATASAKLYLTVYSNGAACTFHIFELFLLEVT